MLVSLSPLRHGISKCNLSECSSAFSVNAELIKNTASFDPQRFDELLENGIQLESIEKIANIIDVPWSSLRSELLSFISVFKSLGRT